MQVPEPKSSVRINCARRSPVDATSDRGSIPRISTISQPPAHLHGCAAVIIGSNPEEGTAVGFYHPAGRPTASPAGYFYAQLSVCSGVYLRARGCSGDRIVMRTPSEKTKTHPMASFASFGQGRMPAVRA